MSVRVSSIYVVSFCLLTTALTLEFFNKKLWFEHGNIFHIDQKPFWNTFQQHRNVNRHLYWLTNEILSINSQIRSIKNQILLINHSIESTKPTVIKKKPDLNQTNSPRTKIPNDQNIYILKLLSNDILFTDNLQILTDIYEYSSIKTIECIAILIEQNSNTRSLLIKLTNGYVDKYLMNNSKTFEEIVSQMPQPIISGNNDQKLPEYYRRFFLHPSPNNLMINDQLLEIKNRPRVADVHFFDMMGQILRIKYHTDPSSLSCILEVFFGPIYTCDGRLIHPHELKLLSDNNDAFVFYAIIIDTTTEKQIYPIDANYRIRLADQIYFLFENHPQFKSLSSFACTNCPRDEQASIIDKNQQTTENELIQTQLSIEKPISTSFLTNSQNYIVYAIVTSILVYILIGICLSRKHELDDYIPTRKSSISSRRGR